MRNALRAAVCLALLPLAGLALASDAIDSKINPQNGYVETVKSEAGSSSDDVHLYLAQGLEETPTVLDVSTNASDDESPRIEVTPAGDGWMTWWRDESNDQVRVRKFSHVSQTFGSDRLVSQSSENARNPEILFDGTSVWIVYEVHGSSKSIIVSVIGDEPDPIPTGVTLRTISYGGNVDARIHADAGHLWVTWVDSATSVGWSELDYSEATWSDPSFESTSGSTINAARQAIRSAVTGS